MYMDGKGGKFLESGNIINKAVSMVLPVACRWTGVENSTKHTRVTDHS